MNAQAAAVEAVHEACRKTALALCGATVPGVSPEAGALVAEAYELLCRARRVAGAGPAARRALMPIRPENKNRYLGDPAFEPGPTDPEPSSAVDGVWVTYYSDRSAVVVFATELEALRHAVELSMQVEFRQFGVDLFRGQQ